jgi:hypothetical protein
MCCECYFTTIIYNVMTIALSSYCMYIWNTQFITAQVGQGSSWRNLFSTLIYKHIVVSLSKWLAPEYFLLSHAINHTDLFRFPWERMKRENKGNNNRDWRGRVGWYTRAVRMGCWKKGIRWKQFLAPCFFGLTRFGEAKLCGACLTSEARWVDFKLGWELFSMYSARYKKAVPNFHHWSSSSPLIPEPNEAGQANHLFVPTNPWSCIPAAASRQFKSRATLATAAADCRRAAGWLPFLIPSFAARRPLEAGLDFETAVHAARRQEPRTS